MALSLSEIKAAIQNPKAKAQLAKAVKHEQRLRFHAEEVQDSSDASLYSTEYLNWVKQLLPSDKAQMFEVLMQYPIYTNEIIKTISEEYMKVYDAENSSFSYEFTNDNAKNDFLDYLVTENFWQTWKNESSDAMVRAINSILIVDMPTDGEQTEPYHYFQAIEEVKDIELDDDGCIAWLIVQQGTTMKDRTYFVVDDESYRVVDKDGNEIINTPHGLGYTPACFFWSEPMTKRNPLVKRSPITAALNNLNWLLFCETARRCLELYASYPVYVSFEPDCKYSTTFDDIGEVFCKSGVLDMGNGRTSPCPSCSGNKFLGPGTHLTVPMPKPSDRAEPNNIDAVKVIPAEITSLDYNKARSSELWDEIFYDCVGNDSTVIDNQAINRDQVKAHFSSQENILYNLKENLEKAHAFVIETKARLIYENAFVSCSINYGTDWYLKSGEEVIKEYAQAKSAGVPQYFLNYKRQQIDNIATKGNSNDTERLMILKHLEPWIDLSLNDCKNLGLKEVNPQMFLLKADFSRLILKFENEFGSITNFGSLIDFQTKIQRIQQKLNEYVEVENKSAIESTIAVSSAKATESAAV